jgi:hypothetical protein
MSYYTTVITVNNNGKPVQADVTCGGANRGFTDADTGKLTFILPTNDTYDISAKRSGETAKGSVRGGKEVVLRVR